MIELKVGDRVRVYGHFKGVSSGTVIGTPAAEAFPDWVAVKDDNGEILHAHSKQCRKLVPKRKDQAA